MQAEQKQNLPQVFLFVNSGSGGGVGKELLESQTNKLTFSVPRSQMISDKNNLVTINVRLFNMRDEQSRKTGFQQLALLIKQKKAVILVICGGDGTVMWVTTEMSSHDIEHSRVPIAIIPLGTGNDFARVLGWGQKSPDIVSNNYAKLKKRISYWLSAQEQNVDIWMVEAEVYQYGKFQKVENSESKVLNGKTITKHFCNYFSMGIDGKIGYSFDLHRTSTRLGNLAMYGAMGAVKSLTKTKTLGELAMQFRQSKNKGISEEEVVPLVEQETSKKSSDTIIFQRGAQNISPFKDNQNLLALNINSFMGGVKDVWANASLPDHLKNTSFVEPNHEDGKIEIVSFAGAISLGFQKTMGGQAVKVHQGSGPFQLTFNKYPQQQKHRTYLQIDGQFVRFTHPKSLQLRRSHLSKSGQIRVLRRVPLQVQKTCCASIK